MRQPWNSEPKRLAHADQLAAAVGLDMAEYWTPTVDSYLGRVIKARIMEAVREGVSDRDADSLVDLKRPTWRTMRNGCLRASAGFLRHYARRSLTRTLSRRKSHRLSRRRLRQSETLDGPFRRPHFCARSGARNVPYALEPPICADCSLSRYRGFPQRLQCDSLLFSEAGRRTLR